MCYTAPRTSYHRIQLGNTAPTNFKKVLLQQRRIALRRKLQVYQAEVFFSGTIYGSDTAR